MLFVFDAHYLPIMNNTGALIVKCPSLSDCYLLAHWCSNYKPGTLTSNAVVGLLMEFWVLLDVFRLSFSMPSYSSQENSTTVAYNCTNMQPLSLLCLYLYTDVPV